MLHCSAAHWLYLQLLFVASVHADVGSIPFVTKVRPRPQTPLQASALAKTVLHAQEKSDAAKAGLLNHLDTQLRKGLHHSLQDLSASDLLERLTWELRHLPIIHNGPAAPYDPKAPFASSGGGFNTSLRQGYVENVCQAVVMGGKPAFTQEFDAELAWMVRFMGFPSTLRTKMLSGDATMSFAGNCVKYYANNLQKKAGGNFIYGPITYVLNSRSKSQWAVSAYDSGAFFGFRGAHYGTHDHFYHLVQPNERVLGIDWARLMNRWWVPGIPVPTGWPAFNSYPYFEYNHFGALHLPEDILYITMKFSTSFGATGFWGTELGELAQSFLRKHNRPLVWANTEDGGMIIDPTVGNINGSRISSKDISDFRKHWNSKISFEDLYQSVPPYLQLHYQSWNNKAACEAVEASPDNMVMGVDGEGNCVYWKWTSSATKYECALDGTCFKSSSARAIYSSEEECESHCGKGKWSCIQTTKVPSGSSHHCEPDAQGSYANLDECESGVPIGPGVKVGMCASPYAMAYNRTLPGEDKKQTTLLV